MTALVTLVYSDDSVDHFVFGIYLRVMTVLITLVYIVVMVMTVDHFGIYIFDIDDSVDHFGIIYSGDGDDSV